jgi:inner membrane transporter RhtA
MVSLLPATATIIGLLVLAQVPTAAELAGVAGVIAAIAIHREPAGERVEPDAEAIAA